MANPDTQVNYLIPTDVADADDASIWFHAFEQTAIIDRLSQQASNATHYVVFDACRNELNLTGPAAKALGAEKGFVPVAHTAGLLIAYATAPKKTASDAGEGSGPYAKALAEEIVKPGVEAVSMFRAVQLRVQQAIGQDPWLSFPALPEVYLAGKSVQKPPESPPVPAPAPTAFRLSEAAEAWNTVRDTNSTFALETYIRRFGDTFYGDLAKARLAELKQADLTAQAKRDLEARQKAEADAAAKRKADEEAQGVPAPGQTFRDCAECPEMVMLPSGSFTMGSNEYDDEKPPHRVTIGQPFAVAKFEVTFADWEACVKGGGCADNRSPNDQGWGRGRRPVIYVSWNDAKEYAAWLGAKTGKTYRLLSEAEWEYAARAGTTTKYAFGYTITTRQAQFSANRTVEVGKFAPNAWGLHDMHGNVWEWCEDNWHPNYQGAPNDGSVSPGGDTSLRVVRGGSWGNSSPDGLRSSIRYSFQPVYRGMLVGFRLARTL